MRDSMLWVAADCSPDVPLMSGSITSTAGRDVSGAIWALEKSVLAAACTALSKLSSGTGAVAAGPAVEMADGAGAVAPGG